MSLLSFPAAYDFLCAREGSHDGGGSFGKGFRGLGFTSTIMEETPMKGIWIIVALFFVVAELSLTATAQQGSPAGKFDVDLEYLFYHGGSGYEMSKMVRVDRAGNVYFCGRTGSADFPQIPPAAQPSKYGNPYVVKCGPQGNIIYSICIPVHTNILDVAVGADDALVLLVQGSDLDSLLTPDAQYRSRGAYGLIVLDSAVTISYVSYLPTEGLQEIVDMESDSYGDIYMLAHTYVSPPMATHDAMFPINQGSEDGFIMKFCGPDYSLAYATCFGGAGHEEYTHIAVDDSRIAIVGITWDSGDYPVVNALQTQPAGGMDFILSCLSNDGQRILYSTYLGGSGTERWNASATNYRRLRFDKDGNLYFMGESASRDFPITDTVTSVPPRGKDAIVLCKFSPDGNLRFSTFLASSSSVFGGEMDVDSCGTVILSGYSYSEDFPLVNPIFTTGNSFLAVVDTRDGSMPFSTRTGENLNRIRSCSLTLDGVTVFASGLADAATGLPPTGCLPGPHMVGYDPFFAAFSMPDLCRREALNDYQTTIVEIAIDLEQPDSLRIDLVRNLVLPHVFPLRLTVRNLSSSLSTDSMRVHMKIPDRLEILSGSPPLKFTLNSLAPLEHRVITWFLRPLIDSIPPLTELFIDAFVSQYRICTGSAWEAVRIPVIYTDLTYTEVMCEIALTDSLTLSAEGTRLSSDTATVRVRITNLTDEEAPLNGVQLEVPANTGVTLVPPPGSYVPLTPIPAQGSVDVYWKLRLPSWQFDRSLDLTAVLVDTFDYAWQYCVGHWRIPGASSSICTITAPPLVSCPTGGDCTPSPVEVHLFVENPSDTMRFYSALHLDLSSAPHLTVSPGDSLTRNDFYVRERFRRVFLWDLLPIKGLTENATDTVRAWYLTRADSVLHSCEAVINIEVLTSEVSCGIIAEDSLTVKPDGRSLVEDTVSIMAVFCNSGNIPKTLTHALLTTGRVYILGSEEQTMQEIAAGTHDTLVWLVRVPAFIEERNVDFIVTAYEEGDVEATRCVHVLHVPAVEPFCVVSAPDTLHYDRTTGTYSPAVFEVVARFTNPSDEALSRVQAVLDTSVLRRCRLLSEEVLNTTGIGAGDSWEVSWSMEPLWAAGDEQEEFRVRFTVVARGVETQCTHTLYVEGGIPERILRCETAGHDTVWADIFYERLIPDPVQLQYTLRNDGGSVISLCEIAILTPPMLSLLPGEDSIRQVPDLYPGESFSAEWMLGIIEDLVIPAPWPVRWQTQCGDSIMDLSCDATITILERPPSGVVLSPWILRFEALQNGSLPAAREVRIWTGGGRQPRWIVTDLPVWIDAVPLTGEGEVQMTVQPNTTALALGAHSGEIDFSHTPLCTGDIQVVYVLSTPLAVHPPMPAPELTLGPIYPNPVVNNLKIVIECQTTASTLVTFTVFDLLGREVWRRNINTDHRGKGMARMSTKDLSSGNYILSARAGAASATTMLVIAR